MSLGIILPPKSHLTQEEKRNKLLRQRYGSAGSNFRLQSSFLNEKLLVVGTSVYLTNELMKSQKFTLAAVCRDSNNNNNVESPNGCRNIRRVKTPPPGRKSVGAMAPPSTPYGISVSESSYDPRQFHESGDLSGLNRSNKQSVNKSGSRGDLDVDFGSDNSTRKQAQQNKEEGGFKYEMYKRQSPKKRSDYARPWLVSNKSKSNLTSIPNTKSSHNTLTGDVKHVHNENQPNQKNRRRLTYTTSSTGSKVRMRKGFSKKKSPEDAKENFEHKKLMHTLSEMEKDMQSAAVIRKFRDMPKSKPYIVCFDYPGVNLCHADVKRAIEKVLPNSFKTKTVVSVQFENQNVKLRTCEKENRWLIKFVDLRSRNKVIKSGLDILESGKLSSPKWSGENISKSSSSYKHVDVMLFDTVLLQEYEIFLRRINAGEKLNSLRLMCAGTGHKLLTKLI